MASKVVINSQPLYTFEGYYEIRRHTAKKSVHYDIVDVPTGEVVYTSSSKKVDSITLKKGKHRHKISNSKYHNSAVVKYACYGHNLIENIGRFHFEGEWKAVPKYDGFECNSQTKIVRGFDYGPNPVKYIKNYSHQRTWCEWIVMLTPYSGHYWEDVWGSTFQPQPPKNLKIKPQKK